jgi:hypothetical protein
MIVVEPPENRQVLEMILKRRRLIVIYSRLIVILFRDLRLENPLNFQRNLAALYTG